MRVSRGGALGGQGVPGARGRRKEEGRAVRPEYPQGWVWTHLERVGGAQLREVPDFGSAEAARDLSGGQEGQGLPSTALYAQARGASGRGTARERARSQLAPKIPNRSRVSAQERLLLRPLPDSAHRKAQSSGALPLTSLRARRLPRPSGSCSREFLLRRRRAYAALAGGGAEVATPCRG